MPGVPTVLDERLTDRLLGDRGLRLRERLTQAHAGYPILVAGTREQRRRFLPELCAGGAYRSLAITEPGAGSDASRLGTTARWDGDGYLLDGGKTFITTGEWADIIVCFATVDPGAGRHGITAFLVPGDAPGLSRGRVLRSWDARVLHRRAMPLLYSVAAEVDEAGDQQHPAGQAADIAMMKLTCTDLAMAVATEVRDLLGPAGNLTGMRAERYLRDAKVTQIYEGTNQIQRMVMARQLLK